MKCSQNPILVDRERDRQGPSTEQRRLLRCGALPPLGKVLLLAYFWVPNSKLVLTEKYIEKDPCKDHVAPEIGNFPHISLNWTVTFALSDLNASMNQMDVYS